mgnify:CR=1 FL=1
MTQTKLDNFTLAYIECALWSSTDENDESLDRNYGREDLASETLDSMIADCAKFQDANSEWFNGDITQAGHDFWLTRNRHGAGYWDGDWAEPGANKMTEAAHAFGESNLYVGDDGLIYC